jgi:hypothetical protein
MGGSLSDRNRNWPVHGALNRGTGGRLLEPSDVCVVRYILVNDASLKFEARCARCRSKLGERYVREIGSVLLFCDANCYTGDAITPVAHFEGRPELQSHPTLALVSPGSL